MPSHSECRLRPSAGALHDHRSGRGHLRRGCGKESGTRRGPCAFPAGRLEVRIRFRQLRRTGPAGSEHRADDRRSQGDGDFAERDGRPHQHPGRDHAALPEQPDGQIADHQPDVRQGNRGAAPFCRTLDRHDSGGDRAGHPVHSEQRLCGNQGDGPGVRHAGELPRRFAAHAGRGP